MAWVQRSKIRFDLQQAASPALCTVTAGGRLMLSREINPRVRIIVPHTTSYRYTVTVVQTTEPGTLRTVVQSTSDRVGSLRRIAGRGSHQRSRHPGA